MEKKLKECLAKEVDLYLLSGVSNKCYLCPFREFKRAGRLQNHLKFHCEKNMYLADIRSPQLNVIRALFDRNCSLSPISYTHTGNTELLQHSAKLIMN